MAIAVTFALRPYVLPPPPATGRAVVLDVAFAFGADFAAVTGRYLAGLGARLAAWVDHHDHPRWRDYAVDPRFVLVPRTQARACPQLVTPQLVARVGPVQHLLAHGDFDGCMAAAKFLRGGVAPYPEADEDARAADAPGQGFVCSPRGLAVLRALEQAQAAGPEAAYLALAQQIVAALAAAHVPSALALQIEALGAAHAARERRLAPLLAAAVSPAAGLLYLRVPARTPHPDKKYLLRALEARARIAAVDDGRWLTVATFGDAEEDGLDLAAVRGLRGQRGYAWGPVRLPQVLPQLVAALREARAPAALTAACSRARGSGAGR